MRSCLSLLLCAFALATPLVRAAVPEFSIRPGYRVELAAEDLQEARFIEFDDRGTLFLSQPAAGVILALRDADGDGRFESRVPFVTGRPTVQGLCFFDGWLYFSQSGSIHRARDDDADGKADQLLTLVPDGQLPSGGGHWFRSLLVSAAGIYTSIGDSGNITDESDTERQKIWRFDLDGRNKRLFASGLRNTEKLRLRPGSEEVWGCDHGSDNFGQRYGESRARQPITDLNPPEELNHYQQGGFYGHPFITGQRIPRPEFHQRKDLLELAEKTIPPAWAFPAHWAPNGFAFLSRDYFPGHRGDAIVAFHGSWNRSSPAGYRVERVLFDPHTGRPFGTQTLVTTLSPQGQVLARPCDVAEAPDGTVFFTCDQTKRIFRLLRN